MQLTVGGMGGGFYCVQHSCNLGKTEFIHPRGFPRLCDIDRLAMTFGGRPLDCVTSGPPSWCDVGEELGIDDHPAVGHRTEGHRCPSGRCEENRPWPVVAPYRLPPHDPDGRLEVVGIGLERLLLPAVPLSPA